MRLKGLACGQDAAGGGGSVVARESGGMDSAEGLARGLGCRDSRAHVKRWVRGGVSSVGSG